MTAADTHGLKPVPNGGAGWKPAGNPRDCVAPTTPHAIHSCAKPSYRRRLWQFGVGSADPTYGVRSLTVVSYRTPSGTGTATGTVVPWLPAVRVSESTATNAV